jgi:hypothetical protein
MVWIQSINKGTHLMTGSDPAEDKSESGANFDVNIVFSIHKYARLSENIPLASSLQGEPPGQKKTHSGSFFRVVVLVWAIEPDPQPCHGPEKTHASKRDILSRWILWNLGQ